MSIMELSSEAQLLLLNLLPHHCGGINDKRDEDVENNKVYDHLDDCWVPRTAIGRVGVKGPFDISAIWVQWRVAAPWTLDWRRFLQRG